MEVRHEALAQDFKAGLAEVSAFLGVEAHPAMADVGATARKRRVRTPSAPLVRAGLTAARLGRWRAYAEFLTPVLDRLEPWIRR